MKFWRRRARGPRRLEMRQACQILYRGGVLVSAGPVWAAYRTDDTRRMRIGVVPDALAEQLESRGLAQRLSTVPRRLVAGPSLDAQALAAAFASD